ncbi:S8 family serine peptidase [Streptomyces sp. B1866]|uniref:S53 family peptidase n=1 Tax=Streptomyces sp. B1866 TaxID=3075431 RepID=UPI0028920BD9|nr:S8 family serine peptidase [Streptomyces sp. B1866]MDT3396314.1 S8 family serine peptidase [Streptomyces sp. B1866]
MIHRSRFATSAVAAALAGGALMTAATVPLGPAASAAPPAASSASSPCQQHTGHVCYELLPGGFDRLHARADGGADRRASVAPPTSTPPGIPWTPASCRVQFGKPCYTVSHLAHAYGVDRLHARGVDGAGQTIAVIMPLGNPTVQHDMDVFSDANGLPRTRVEVIERGDVQAADPADPVQAQNIQEAQLDLELAHAMAPRARLILVSTARNVTSGTTGWAEVSEAAEWVTAHRDVTVLSWSYGFYEDNAAEEAGQPGDYHRITPLRRGLEAAATRGTTLIAAAGDTGATGPNLAGTAFYPHPSVPWPASDPLVTGVAGTALRLDDHGRRITDDRLWTDDGSGHATGAGRSRIWPSNSTADIALVGSPASRVVAYSSANVLPGQSAGWFRAAGTSVAAPLMAGITALAAQQAGHHLGRLAPRLKRIEPGTHGTYDLARGCNTAHGVTGVCAAPGRDDASGIGTLTDATAFTRALARR